MISLILLYTGVALITLWGMAHLLVTRSVVQGFGTLSNNNWRIITMEWAAEGMTLCFIGLLVGAVTLWGGHSNPVSVLVYRACAVMLLLMAGWSAMTGARTTIVPMRLCPVVKTVVALLFLLASI